MMGYWLQIQWNKAASILLRKERMFVLVQLQGKIKGRAGNQMKQMASSVS
jgi:hypothetical protein